MKQVIAYCGLDCEKCEARIATVNNDNDLRVKVGAIIANNEEARKNLGM
ncbi:Protein of unknown function [Lachnospiraceae bacterium]|nr:Protein of unknown function [Lachnospiraceae bacterium]